MEPIPFNRPPLDAHAEARVLEALRSGRGAGDGPFTRRAREELERMIPGTTALLTTSCTSALEMCALLLDLGPGDEFILPSFTFVSTANAFCLRGAVPVFVDVEPGTMNLDPAAVAAAITPRTRAVVVMHYAGVACSMEPILAAARAAGAAVVEDAAQGIGASWRGQALGGIGQLGTLSFHETKNVGCGEGGALLIRDPAMTARAEVIREKGTNRSRFLRGQVDKYTWESLGGSFLLSDVLAAMLSRHLERTEEYSRARLRIWNEYHQALEPLERAGVLERPRVPAECRHNGHIYFVRTADADARGRLMQHLAGLGIAAYSHYEPLHLAPMGRRYGGRPGQLPVTEREAARLLRLPMWADLPADAVARVVEGVRSFYGRGAAAAVGGGGATTVARPT
ncbi:MAG: dTDP-4-amino-4,6-dideoxygalactose transaminase [Phycisphaerales bacterium]